MPARARRPEGPTWRHLWVGTFAFALVLTRPGLCGACDDPPRVDSMSVKGDVKSSYNPGETVKYECRPGYRRTSSASTTITCNDDGTWTELRQDVCVKKKCPHPQQPSNGDFQVESLDFGSQVHYSCFEGFRLLGPKTLYCELSGSTGNAVDWSEDPPICQKVLCRPPEEIPNGKFSNSHKDVFEYGEVVTYSCNTSPGSDDYSLIGEKNRVCLSNGSWTGTPPRCEVVKCDYPNIVNGNPKPPVPKKRLYNTTVMIECKQGFVLKGSEIIRCDADSTWKPGLPECVVPGSRPTPTTTTTTTTTTTATPASRDPGPVVPSEPPEEPENFGGGIIAVIVIIPILGVLIAGLGAYYYLQRKKRVTKSSETSFSTYRSKSNSPAEESD